MWLKIDDWDIKSVESKKTTNYTVYCGRMASGLYNVHANTHKIQDLTEFLCRTQAIFYALPNNRRGTKYRGFTYSARVNL